jgi:hypothetical protein
MLCFHDINGAATGRYDFGSENAAQAHSFTVSFDHRIDPKLYANDDLFQFEDGELSLAMLMVGHVRDPRD